MNKPVEQSQTRRLQMMELDIFKKVIEICNKYNLRYFALDGTLLGAIRHQGFIPWDDDIDIGMPRDDYEKFLHIASKELPQYLKVSKYTDHKRPIIYFTQIYNINTKLLNKSSKKVRETNVWIDIFPIDGMPNNNILRKIHSLKLLFIRMLIQFSVFDENVHSYRKNRPLHEKILIKFCQVTNIGKSFDSLKLMKNADVLLRKYEYNKSNYIVDFFSAYKFKEMFPKYYYGEGIQVPFEDITINVPVKHRDVLSQIYGDYMKLPSEQDKYTQHCIEIVEL